MLKGRWQKVLAFKARDAFQRISSGWCCCSVKVRQLKAVALVLVAIVVFFYVATEWFGCGSRRSQRVLDALCQRYRSGEVDGDTCPSFCGGLDGRPAIVPAGSCVWHGSKDVVFEATMGQRRIFVKGHVDDGGGDDERLVPLGSRPTKESFLAMLSAYLKDNYGVGDVDEAAVLERLFPESVESWDAGGDSGSLAFLMDDMWALVQDDEYVHLRLHRGKPVFPVMYGRCGRLYVVEWLEPLPAKGRGSFREFSKKVAVSLAIIDLLDQLSSVFREPIHLCDVKPDHFGISDQGAVKFVDLDSVFFRSTLGETMRRSDGCDSHGDCDLFDCRGECDLIKGECRNAPVNNNLQVVCEKVFSGGRGSYIFGGGPAGLLSSRHASKRLVDAVRRCANPTGNKQGIRLAASEGIRKELVKALEEVIDVLED